MSNALNENSLARIICGVADHASLVMHYMPAGGWVASVGGVKVIRVESDQRVMLVTGRGHAAYDAIHSLYRLLTDLPAGARIVVRHGRHDERSVRWDPVAAEWQTIDPHHAR